MSTQGNANLFFINANGISFGSSGHIQSGGSVFLSTASIVDFLDGNKFITDDSNSLINLSGSNPIGLEFQNNVAGISIQGNGHTLINPIFMPIVGANPSSSEFILGKDGVLSLSSGNISLDGGILVQQNGNINLASINTGTLSFITPQGNFDYSAVKSYGNITLTNNALVQLVGAGNIDIASNNLSVNKGSVVLTINDLNSSDLGDINIDTVNSVELDGALSSPLFPSAIRTENLTDKTGGDISINASNLNVINGGQLVTRSFGSGSAGVINIDSGEILLNGYLAASPNLFSALSSATFGFGSAGNIFIKGNDLNILNGGDTGSATFGPGSGGNVNFEISNNIHVSGIVPALFTPSVINAATFGPGTAGNVNITTQNLLLDSGGRISTSTVSSGAAGSLKIQAFKDIKVTGTVPGSITPSSIDSSASQVDPRLAQQLQLVAPPTGQSGTLTLTSPSLEILDGAQVTTRNEGPGNAGQLSITTGQTILKNSSILASTQGGDGGDINFATGTLVSQNSSITAAAQGSGRGGNIILSAQGIGGDYSSAISANAVKGFGGNINLDTNALIFPLSNITATSDNGIAYQGTVTVKSISFTPVKSSVAITNTFVRKPINICNPSDGQSFVISAANIPEQIDDLDSLGSTVPNIPYTLDNQGHKHYFVAMQGYIANSNGTAKTIAYNNQALGGSYVAKLCRIYATENEIKK